MKNEVPGTQATPTFSASSSQNSTSVWPGLRNWPMLASTKYAPCGSVYSMPMRSRPEVNSCFMCA